MKILTHSWWMVEVPPLLNGFICVFHPATQGSSPNHSNYALVNWIVSCGKYVNKQKWDWPIFETHLWWEWLSNLRRRYLPVWPDWAIYWTLGNFLKPLATINLPKSPTFLGKFWKGVKIFHISSEITFGQLLQTFGDFFWSHCLYLRNASHECA